MDKTTILLYLISTILALIPALIWFFVLFKKNKNRKIQLILFIGSTFSIVPVFLLNYLLNIFPELDILAFLQKNINEQNINYILMFISVGIVEEIVKQILIRTIDKKYLLINTINDSIRYSLVGALGFAFAENIFYIVNIYTFFSIQDLIITYLFRSIFTTIAHMLFSGVFGYYYAIAKFAINITEEKSFMGKTQKTAKLISKLLNTSKIQTYREIMILKGLSLAIILHATFNLLLQFNQILPVAIFVLIGFGFLSYKLKEKTGQLILISNRNNEIKNMSKRDSDVVVELLALWFNEKRYVDVIHICQRILERDPKNQIVQIFKAKALDQMKKDSVYKKILNNLYKTDSKKEGQIEKIVKEKEINKQKIKIKEENTGKNNFYDLKI